jgi:outer membrane protein
MAKIHHLALVVAVSLSAATAAQAQQAGAVIVRGGVTQIKPDVKSGNLSTPSFTGTQADIEAATTVTGGITYMLSDQVSLDLPLAAGFKHDIVGAGAIEGVGKIGEVKVLPATLLAQYRFGTPKSGIRPYLGLGATYAKFYKAKGTAALTALTGGTPSNPTTLEVDSKFALTAQAGVSHQLSGRWSLDVAVLKTALKTRTTLSTGQTLDATLNPWSFTLGVGYQF